MEASGVSPDNLIRVQWGAQGPLEVLVPLGGEALGARLQALLAFAQGAATLLRGRHPTGALAVQLHDEQPQGACFRFDAPLAPDAGGPLIPDPYCLMGNGYQAIREAFEARPLPPWQERLPLAFWRGSTTGSKALTPAGLAENQRYRLCRWSRQLPAWVDARFSAVVQARDGESKALVQEQLEREQLWSPRVDPWHGALHRWLLEIDGNVNSWGLLWKLLSGACVVRVISPRRQWYHRRLEPWVHLVPIAADLSDLPERLEWCRAHPQQCAAIAAAGKQLAEQVVADLEQDLLAATVSYSQQWMHR
jgi:hypothetical protein